MSNTDNPGPANEGPADTPEGANPAGAAAEAGAPPQAGDDGGRSARPLYADRTLFIAIVGLLTALFVLVLFFFSDRLLTQNILLFATITAALTGVLGGAGVFRSEKGYVTGAGAIFLMLVVVIEGGRGLWYSSQIEEKNAQIEELNSEILARKGEIEDLENELSKVWAKASMVELDVACAERFNSEGFVAVRGTEQTDPPIQMAGLVEQNTAYQFVPRAGGPVTGAVPAGPYQEVSGVPASRRPPVFIVTYRPGFFDQVSGQPVLPKISVSMPTSSFGNPCATATQ